MSFWGTSIDARRGAALAWAGLGCLLVLAAAGCNHSEAQFQFNRLYAQFQASKAGNPSFPTPAAQQVVNATTTLFGTPDDPYLPPEALGPVDDVLNRDLLKLAAGPVRTVNGSTKSGLYRQHCVHCHGISGDGMGPTALYLNPYPRDYRAGVFKFKSTPKGSLPTHEDLRKIIVDGVPGTAMPSFKLLSSDEIEALTDYVKYLTIRGMSERTMIETLASDETALNNLEIDALISAFYTDPVDKWRTSDAQAVAVPARPEWTKEERTEAIAKGQQFFYGAGACFTCHGDTQLGDALENKYDEWSEYLSPTNNKNGIGVYLSLGAFPPRMVKPRNLRSGVYRGGRRPLDLYWRIKNGIDGSGMPAVPYRAAGAPEDPKQLSDENIWQLIEYVRSLPYEPISDPFSKHAPTYQRPLN